MEWQQALQNIFITGASGCIGHYVVEALVQRPDCHLYLLLRNPEKLKLDISGYSDRITILKGDLLQIEQQAAILWETDILIHLAAAWGGEAISRAVNVTQTLAMFELLDGDRCQKIIYFSTASLLDQQNQPVEVAGRAGTDYIRSKYEMLMRRHEAKLSDRILTVYPTLVFGGDEHHPHSHIAGGLKDVMKWMGLVRFFKADGSFHFLHAEDIAKVVAHLLDSDERLGDWVMGNPALHVNDCIEQVCAFYKKRIFFRIPLPIKLGRALAVLFGAQLSEWDDYCIQHRHFVHHAVSPTDFQLPISYPTVASLLDQYG